MDADRFDRLLRTVAGATRRGVVRAMASAVVAGIAGSAVGDEAGAKACPPCRRKKKGKCKKKRPNGTPCEGGRGLCQGGSCRCGGGPICAGGEVCQAGSCFPRSICAAEAAFCDDSIECSAVGVDACFCGTTVEGATVCAANEPFCAGFTVCQASSQCTPPRACVDVNGCCDPPDPGVVGVCLLPCPTPE